MIALVPGTKNPAVSVFIDARAILRSFVGSWEMVKVDPFDWFQDVLSRIGEQSIQKLDELLPHRWAAAQLAQQ
jgi:hypothetical protein